jgi:general secretion pathway protein G
MAQRYVGFVVLVLLMVGGYAFLYLPIVSHDSVARAREAVLRSDLQEIRQAIRSFTADKKRPPKALQELVDEKYLRSIPIDPVTRKRDWRLSDPIFGPDKLIAGTVKVSSASDHDALDGSTYSTW